MTTDTTENTDATDPETTETPETPQEAAESAPETSGEAEDQEARKGNPEAAKWRTRFREAEARLEAMRRAEIIRQATGPGKLVDGEDLFRIADVDDLLDDDGNLDTDKIAAVVTSLTDTKPHLARPAFGDGVGIGERSPATGATWAEVIRG